MSISAPDPRTRLRRPYEACPLCDSRQFGKLREDDCRRHEGYDPGLPPTMTWCLCGDCGHCFAEGFLTGEGLDLVFRKTQDAQNPAVVFQAPEKSWQPGNYPVEVQRRIWAPIVERVTRLRGVQPARDDKWIDVGCGNGMLLFTAWEWGYHAIGLDMRKDTVDMLRGMQVEAHNIDFEAYDSPPGSISVISMANVLEHIPFPKPALRHAAYLLKPNGLIFLSTPNGDTVVWKYLDSFKRNPYWYEIEHCHNFTRNRLHALLDELGFEFLDYNINIRYRTGMEIMARKRAA